MKMDSPLNRTGNVVSWNIHPSLFPIVTEVPKWCDFFFRFVPIIPMVLVNGSEGIGTGWSSNVPNYNPRDIIANLKRLLNNKPVEPMDPWYKGFKVSKMHLLAFSCYNFTWLCLLTTALIAANFCS
jgi:hypothetical protein